MAMSDIKNAALLALGSSWLMETYIPVWYMHIDIEKESL